MSYYGSGPFYARGLGPEWAPYALLARLCEEAELTNRQAQVTLLWCRGCTYAQIRDALGVSQWKHVHRAVRQANHRLGRRFPALRAAAELARDADVQEALTLLDCIRNSLSGSDHGPLLAIDDGYGEDRIRAATLRARVLTVDDLVSRPSLLDVLAALLEAAPQAQS